MTMQDRTVILLCCLLSLAVLGSHCLDDLVPNPEIDVRECNVRADCGRWCERYCCVSNVRPIGRKKRSLAGTFRGTCQPMGQEGGQCLVNNQKGNITGIFFESCPCASGLDCIPNGGWDIPLGPTGICG